MILAQHPLPRARILHATALVVLICLAFGCSSKKPTTIQGGPSQEKRTYKKEGKGKGRTPATQRPYAINGTTYYPIPSAKGYVEEGIASWYGEPFHGKKTSSGEIYDMYGTTAAHKTLPMNTVLLVKNLENGRSTLVRINDRGPFVQERIIDLTLTKAKELGIVGKGTAKVEIVAMETEQQREEYPAMVASAPPAPPSKPSVGKEKPAVVAAPKPQPKAPPLPDFDQGNFYVQVGAFTKISNARLLAKAFAQRGRDVIIQQYPAAGLNLYRVMIFASHSLTQAKLFEKELKAEGFKYALLLAR